MQVLQPIIHSFSFGSFFFPFVHTVFPSHTCTVKDQTLFRNQHLGHKLMLECRSLGLHIHIYIPYRVSMKQVLRRHWRTKVNARECHWSWSYDVIGEQRWTPESVTEADRMIYQENKSECQRRTKVELLAFTVHVSVSLSLCRPCSLWSVSKYSWLCSDCRGKQLPLECVSKGQTAPSGVCLSTAL